jgi:hypothetical protein
MQAFADQMALAAANELDGQEDSIPRALNAVFGQAGEAPYLAKAGIEVGQFEVESIAFYATMAPTLRTQNDMTEAFPASAELARAVLSPGASDPQISFSGDQGEASRAALFAVVKARDAATKSTLVNMTMTVMSLGNNFGDAGLELHQNGVDLFEERAEPFEQNLEFGAVAAASVDVLNCANLSTLVFCNPWEDQENNLLEEDPSTPGHSLPGRSLIHFAPNGQNPNGGFPVLDGRAEHGSVYPWDVNHQLFKLTGPLADEAQLCDEQNVPRLFDGEDYTVARDRCLMARANVDQVCWSENDPLTIRPAHGPDVSRAVNTIFDIWMEPFETAIGDNNQLGDTGLRYNQFFEPDAVATSLWEPADYYGDPNTEMQDGNYDYADLPQYTAFLGHTGPKFGLAVTNMYAAGLGYDGCHANTYRRETGGGTGGECAIDFIGDHYESNAATTAGYVSTALDEFWTRLYRVGTPPPGLPPQYQNPALCGGPLEQAIPSLAEFCGVASLPGDVTTWYQLYLHERAMGGQVVTNGAQSRVQQWADGSTNAPDYQTRYGISQTEQFLKQGPDDYFGISGESTLFSAGAQRRRMRAAMVNCTATTSVGPNDQGDYEVAFEDAYIVDMYLPMPAGHFCGPNIAACTVDVSRETVLYSEVIENVTQDNRTQQFTAQLVR